LQVELQVLGVKRFTIWYLLPMPYHKHDYDYRKKKKQSPPSTRQRIGDYRIFVGAFLTGELATAVQAIRQQYDKKTAEITAPHVTLAGTYWRTGKATPKNEAKLINKLETWLPKLNAFELQLGGIRTFGSRVVYLDVEMTEALAAVRRTLLNVMGADKHRRFAPHLTLAMRLDEAAVEKMVAELRESEWHNGRYTQAINTLHLMQRGDDDPSWRTILSVPLAEPL
jgi:2'-5' RNA ligase